MFERLLIILAICLGCVVSANAADAPIEPTSQAEFGESIRPFLKSFCFDCHSESESAAGFRLDNIDGAVTKGKDIVRWEKTLEMLSNGDMPPEDAVEHPTKPERKAIAAWITAELRKIGRGPDESRLSRPEFGNRVDHEDLFSGEYTGPAWSPSRLWRKTPQIHKAFEKSLKLPEGTTPFNPKGGVGFQDYSTLLANESTIKAIRINAKNYIAEIIDGKLVHPKGPDGKPDRTKQFREGRSRYREFQELIESSSPPTPPVIAAAVDRSFQLLLNRPATEAEVERYGAGYLVKAIEIAGPRAALESLLNAIILSPEFIYRQELGLGKELQDGRRMLAPREIAYAIAYALTDLPPDRELLAAVENGQLSTKADVEREVRRMLSVTTKPYWAYEINHTFDRHIDACPNPRVLRFFREYFGYIHVFDVFKDLTRNPNHKPQFLFKDADLFVLSILEEDRQVLKQLLTSDRYVVHYVSPQQAERNLKKFTSGKNSEAAKELLASGRTPVLGSYRGGQYYTTYGFEKDTWDYPVEQPFAVEHRAGMLTHPAWLVAHSGNFDTDPIRRGKWIREHLLADTIPEIPIGVDAALQEDPHKTLREKLVKTTKQECWRCHKKMNPLGLPFEIFDDFGRYRDQFYFDQDGEFGGTYYERLQRQKIASQRKQPAVEFTSRPIDASGELKGTLNKNLEGEVKDAFELVDRLAQSDLVRQCFIRHVFRYWMGRNETLDDSPTLIAADRAYIESDGSFKELLISLLTSDSFLMRK